MTDRPKGELRRGWTTGACATAATKAALSALLHGEFPARVGITLPRGETPEFALAHTAKGPGWAEAGIVKDAGDDPDVTHGALVIARVRQGAPGTGVTFAAGQGVGRVTMPGLPVPPGEPAINPVPRKMMQEVVRELGAGLAVEITLSIPGGEKLAERTWNPRLGIVGGLSILGTTGVVRPFSCAAWIASIHRGIDVARASGTTHIAGCTGATSETAVQAHLGLPDHAMIDMGDFAGGMLKYLRRHPVPLVTIGGGFGKMVKLAQGAMDLHSGRSQVDFAQLAALAENPLVAQCNTALQVLEISGNTLAEKVAAAALGRARSVLDNSDIAVRIAVVDRRGTLIGMAG